MPTQALSVKEQYNRLDDIISSLTAEELVKAGETASTQLRTVLAKVAVEQVYAARELGDYTDVARYTRAASRICPRFEQT